MNKIVEGIFSSSCYSTYLQASFILFICTPPFVLPCISSWGLVLYGSGWVKAYVYSRNFPALIDPRAILLRALDSQGSPLVTGKGWLDQNTSRRASRSHTFCSLLRFRMWLNSVPVLLSDGLECVSEVILIDWSWDQSCFIYSTQTEQFSRYIWRFPAIWFSQLFDNLYFSRTLWSLPHSA